MDSRHHQARTFNVDKVTGEEEDTAKVARASKKVDKASNGNVWYPEQVNVDDGLLSHVEFVVDKDGDKTPPKNEQRNDSCRLAKKR